MLEGLPAVCDHFIRIATCEREGALLPPEPEARARPGPPREPPGSLAIVVFHLLGDLANAAELALTHYLPLTLTEDFLQNSSIGPPYQKWAKFTNEDFHELDLALVRLLPVVWKAH